MTLCPDYAITYDTFMSNSSSALLNEYIFAVGAAAAVCINAKLGGKGASGCKVS